MILFFSVLDNVSIDSEAPMVTSSILRFVGVTQFFRDAHRSRVYVHEFRWDECTLVYMSVCVYTRSRKKKLGLFVCGNNGLGNRIVNEEI